MIRKKTTVDNEDKNSLCYNGSAVCQLHKQAADVAAIPARTTSRDIEPLMRMPKAVFKRGRAKTACAMNGWNRFKAPRGFIELCSI